MRTKRVSAILTVLTVFLFASLASPDAQAATYSFTTFDIPDATHTCAVSINASGQVAGSYVRPASSCLPVAMSCQRVILT
jgi:hypothetical protein